jgi:heat shock protein HslJ
MPVRASRRAAVVGALLAIVWGCSGDGGPGEPSGSLVGRWQLEAFQGADGRPVAVTAPERFTVEFGADGRVIIRADCNTCTGSYQADGTSLTIGPLLACTRAACPSAPVDQQYVAALTGTVLYEIRGDRLTIRSQDGSLQFSRLG